MKAVDNEKKRQLITADGDEEERPIKRSSLEDREINESNSNADDKSVCSDSHHDDRPSHPTSSTRNHNEPTIPPTDLPLSTAEGNLGESVGKGVVLEAFLEVLKDLVSDAIIETNMARPETVRMPSLPRTFSAEYHFTHDTDELQLQRHQQDSLRPDSRSESMAFIHAVEKERPSSIRMI